MEKKPKIEADLFKDTEEMTSTEITAIKQESLLIKNSKDEVKLLMFLNKKPEPKYIKTHPIIKLKVNGENVPYKYVPITYMRTILDAIYPNYSYEIKESKLVANSIQTTVRLYLTDWNGNQFFRDGVGAQKIQVDSGSSPVDMTKMKSDAIQMAAPSSATYAFKNACESLGNLFGRGLNSDIDYMVANNEDLKEMVNKKYDNLFKDDANV